MQMLDFKQNYFQLFGLSAEFHVDKDLLKAKQQALLAEFHPDLFVNASEQDRRLSVQQASHVNEAYQTLLNPVKRARYLLKIKGLELNDETETTSDTGFLMEQLELREQLDECRSNQDPIACCEEISGKLKSRAQQFADEFVTKFSTEQYEAARQVSRKMQFIYRIQEQVLDFQFQLEDELA
ncbi:MAG: Fe-S protein assembly co-chaperone HscB [Gammaproteobacteria bacterium]|nr:Fe-S protein assembly co-chaperone HscB [Gammaproteobacteria bacterium]